MVRSGQVRSGQQSQKYIDRAIETHRVTDRIFTFDRSNIYELIGRRGKTIDRKSPLRSGLIMSCHFVMLNDAKKSVLCEAM